MAWDSEYCKKWKEKNPEYWKEWNKRNPELSKAYQKAYRERFPQRTKATQKAYRERNKERTAARDRARKEKSPEKVRAAKEAWRKANLVRVAQRMREWRARNYERNKKLKQTSWQRVGRETSRKRKNQRRKKEIIFRITENLRNRLKIIVKRAKAKKMAGAHTIRGLTNCTDAFLLKHLESLFLPGMTWNNYGNNGWHIDHIRPCASFNLRDVEEQKRCFNFANLRPLWAIDNLRKHAKWNGVAR